MSAISSTQDLKILLHTIATSLVLNFFSMEKIDVSDLSEESQKVVNCLVKYFDDCLKPKLREIETLKASVVDLQTRVNKLEEEIDNNSAYERRDTLILSGNIPSASPDEHCKSIVVDLLKNKAFLNIQLEDLSVAHRIGAKPKNQGPDRRNIMFKLVRRDLKTDILHACKNSKPDFYINESLTPTRDRIFFTLRRAKKKFPQMIHHCKTYDGNVIVFMHPERASTRKNTFPKLGKYTVNTRRKLEEFLNEKLSSSLEDLQVDWPDEL